MRKPLQRQKNKQKKNFSSCLSADKSVSGSQGGCESLKINTVQVSFYSTISSIWFQCNGQIECYQSAFQRTTGMLKCLAVYVVV